MNWRWLGIEEDLGGPVEDFYEQLDRDPISAASLGQVHKGILKNGQKVAVKVQRPGCASRSRLIFTLLEILHRGLTQTSA